MIVIWELSYFHCSWMALTSSMHEQSWLWINSKSWYVCKRGPLSSFLKPGIVKLLIRLLSFMTGLKGYETFTNTSSSLVSDTNQTSAMKTKEKISEKWNLDWQDGSFMMVSLHLMNDEKIRWIMFYFCAKRVCLANRSCQYFLFIQRHCVYLLCANVFMQTWLFFLLRTNIKYIGILLWCNCQQVRLTDLWLLNSEFDPHWGTHIFLFVSYLIYA